MRYWETCTAAKEEEGDQIPVVAVSEMKRKQKLRKGNAGTVSTDVKFCCWGYTLEVGVQKILEGWVFGVKVEQMVKMHGSILGVFVSKFWLWLLTLPSGQHTPGGSTRCSSDWVSTTQIGDSD